MEISQIREKERKQPPLKNGGILSAFLPLARRWWDNGDGERTPFLALSRFKTLSASILDCSLAPVFLSLTDCVVCEGFFLNDVGNILSLSVFLQIQHSASANFIEEAPRPELGSRERGRRQHCPPIG